MTKKGRGAVVVPWPLFFDSGVKILPELGDGMAGSRAAANHGRVPLVVCAKPGWHCAPGNDTLAPASSGLRVKTI